MRLGDGEEGTGDDVVLLVLLPVRLPVLLPVHDFVLLLVRLLVLLPVLLRVLLPVVLPVADNEAVADGDERGAASQPIPSTDGTVPAGHEAHSLPPAGTAEPGGQRWSMRYHLSMLSQPEPQFRRITRR